VVIIDNVNLKIIRLWHDCNPEIARLKDRKSYGFSGICNVTKKVDEAEVTRRNKVEEESI